MDVRGEKWSLFYFSLFQQTGTGIPVLSFFFFFDIKRKYPRKRVGIIPLTRKNGRTGNSIQAPLEPVQMFNQLVTQSPLQSITFLDVSNQQYYICDAIKFYI